MTAAAPETVDLAGLDFDHQPCCEATACAGDHGPATHWYIPTRCPCPRSLICAVCTSYLLEHAGDWYLSLRCMRCDSHYYAVHLGDVCRVEPLP